MYQVSAFRRRGIPAKAARALNACPSARHPHAASGDLHRALSSGKNCLTARK